MQNKGPQHYFPLDIKTRPQLYSRPEKISTKASDRTCDYRHLGQARYPWCHRVATEIPKPTQEQAVKRNNKAASMIWRLQSALTPGSTSSKWAGYNFTLVATSENDLKTHTINTCNIQAVPARRSEQDQDAAHKTVCPQQCQLCWGTMCSSCNVTFRIKHQNITLVHVASCYYTSKKFCSSGNNVRLSENYWCY